jgi:hypothetical protein
VGEYRIARRSVGIRNGQALTLEGLQELPGLTDHDVAVTAKEKTPCTPAS